MEASPCGSPADSRSAAIEAAELAGARIQHAPRRRERASGSSQRAQGRPQKNAESWLYGLGFARARDRRTGKKFVQALGAGKMRVVTLRQIHSDIVHRVDASAVSQEEATSGGCAGHARARRAARRADGRLRSHSAGGHEKSRGGGDPFRLARHASPHRGKDARPHANGIRHQGPRT